MRHGKSDYSPRSRLLQNFFSLMESGASGSDIVYKYYISFCYFFSIADGERADNIPQSRLAVFDVRLVRSLFGF